MESLRDMKPSASIRADVLQAMQWYLDAADNYVKERAYKTANQCFSMVCYLREAEEG
jgi:Spatacsin C-terminus